MKCTSVFIARAVFKSTKKGQHKSNDFSSCIYELHLHCVFAYIYMGRDNDDETLSTDEKWINKPMQSVLLSFSTYY